MYFEKDIVQMVAEWLYEKDEYKIADHLLEKVPGLKEDLTADNNFANRHHLRNFLQELVDDRNFQDSLDSLKKISTTSDYPKSYLEFLIETQIVFLRYQGSRDRQKDYVLNIYEKISQKDKDRIPTNIKEIIEDVLSIAPLSKDPVEDSIIPTFLVSTLESEAKKYFKSVKSILPPSHLSKISKCPLDLTLISMPLISPPLPKEDIPATPETLKSTKIIKPHDDKESNILIPRIKEEEEKKEAPIEPRSTRSNRKRGRTRAVSAEDGEDEEEEEELTPSKARVVWTEKEIEYLTKGVKELGTGKWVEIFGRYEFHPKRKPTDLKDKWRNILQMNNRNYIPLNDWY
eukprot:TRINITY_DN10866_c0_g1_i1.p1 TRINITY_DN10866_c0_g1~~TRINITY_DN10866_c0_g1_i1.p1  ORF type:complete len:345 (-),score=87.27 TRINITY_DN10866_c0_g1_i1:79-1113(-)